ncbi:MAG: DinB family protein [Thermomicrobiales bacterium]|nr:DinB family protein [Thermomicrobiales bacterium]
MRELLQTTFAYDRWATDRLLDATAGLDPEQWAAPQPKGLRSLRDTLIHQIHGQRRYLAWWDGSLEPLAAYRLPIDPNDFPDPAALRAYWTGVAADTAAFVADLTDEGARRSLTFPLPDGRSFQIPLWQLMLHVANHSTQHRAEAAQMLTTFGRSPGDLDMLFFYFERAEGA